MKIKILLSAAIIILFFSCKKNKPAVTQCNNPVICGDINCFAFWRLFNFTIIDKVSGNNLVFGSTATLSPLDVKLYYNNTQNEITKIVDTASKSFMIFAANDTMLLKIKNEPLKTIIVKTFCAKECCSTTAVEIIYDGQLLIADDKNIFTLKR
jgi:hypothetical protein